MTSKKSILVLDDEESVCFSFHRVLTTHGYDVETAYNAETARDLIIDKKFSVAVIDRVLSGGESGIDFLIRLKNRQPDCQAIMISGIPARASVLDAIKHDAVAYLTKPLETHEILDAIQRALAHRQK